MKILIGYPNLPMMLTPALAVGLFTAICKEEGVEVALFESTSYADNELDGMLFKSKLGGGRSYTAAEVNLDIKPRSKFIPDWQEKVEEYKPDLILISTVEDTFDDTISMLQSIAYLNIPHIVGGVFPINDPDTCMATDAIEVICRYEGELVLRDIIHSMQTDRDWKKVKGIWYKKEDNIVKNPPQPLCNINDITPDYSLYHSRRFLRPIGGRIVSAVQIETYRGCPYSCTYCNSPTTRAMDKQFLRRKTMEQVETELNYYVNNFNPDYWFIGDDSFLARPREEIFKICEVLGKFKLPWWCNTRLENVDTEILQAMKDNYCDRIQFGIESGNEDYRKNILSRKVSDDVYYEKAEILNNSNIPYGLNVIIGLPGETENMIFNTIDMLKTIRGYDGIGVSIFIPYRGTGLHKYAIEQKWLDPAWYSKAGYLKGGSALTMPEPYISATKIWELAETFKYYCFFDKKYWPDIAKAYKNKKLESLEDIYNKEFYTPLASGGDQHRKLRYNNYYACSSDDHVNFKQELINDSM